MWKVVLVVKKRTTKWPLGCEQEEVEEERTHRFSTDRNGKKIFPECKHKWEYRWACLKREGGVAKSEQQHTLWNKTQKNTEHPGMSTLKRFSIQNSNVK